MASLKLRLLAIERHHGVTEKGLADLFFGDLEPHDPLYPQQVERLEIHRRQGRPVEWVTLDDFV